MWQDPREVGSREEGLAARPDPWEATELQPGHRKG